jgi:hypothetical protein
VTFIVDSSPLAMVLVGWVYLLSSSFSFPELLVGFPRAHPALLALFLMRVYGRLILRSSRRDFTLPVPFGSMSMLY